MTRAEYDVDDDDIRRYHFPPSATGLESVVELSAKLTIKCPHCRRPVAWIFYPPHPNYPGPVDVLLRGARPDDPREVEAVDTAVFVIFPGALEEQIPTWCGRCGWQQLSRSRIGLALQRRRRIIPG